MTRTRSQSRGRDKEGDSSSKSAGKRNESNSPPENGRQRLKSVVYDLSKSGTKKRTQSGSRERRPKKCTACESHSDDHDHGHRESMSSDHDGHGDNEHDSDVDHDEQGEPLDYNDVPSDSSPVMGEDDEDDGINVLSDDQLDGINPVEVMPDEVDTNNNAGTSVEVKVSDKYQHKRKSTSKQDKPPSKASKAQRREDVSSSVQTVLSNPEALAQVMKECAPVFAKAMQEAVASTSSNVDVHPTSPLQAVERSRAAKAGETNADISDNFKGLQLRSTRNGAVDNCHPTLSEATIYTRACEQMTPPEDMQLSPETNEPVGSDESMIVSADDNIEFNFAGRSAQHPQQQPVFDAEAETRKRARARATTVVREAENAKATLLKPPGENSVIIEQVNKTQDLAVQKVVRPDLEVPAGVDDDEHDKFRHAFKIDQEFSSLTARVNPEIKRRIEQGQYINLQRLLPKFKVDPNDDHDKYRMVSKDGYSYFVDDRESSNKEDGLPINSIARWDQAFRVFSAIYLEANPKKVSEIAEYTQNMHKWAATYPWQRVYNYDILFRQLVEKKPTRPWDVIHFSYFMGQFGENINLAQSHRVPSGPMANLSAPAGNGGGAQAGFALNKKDCCFRFNKTGKCKFGDSCNWKHKCYLCGLSNHGFNTCRFRKNKGKPGANFDSQSPK